MGVALMGTLSDLTDPGAIAPCILSVFFETVLPLPSLAFHQPNHISPPPRTPVSHQPRKVYYSLPTRKNPGVQIPNRHSQNCPTTFNVSKPYFVLRRKLIELASSK